MTDDVTVVSACGQVRISKRYMFVVLTSVEARQVIEELRLFVRSETVRCTPQPVAAVEA